MKLELHITKTTGQFHIDPSKSTAVFDKSIEVVFAKYKYDFNLIMESYFGADWTPVTDAAWDGLRVGCSSVYQEHNLFICVRRVNHEIIRAEEMTRSYIADGKAVLIGKPGNFHVGKCVLRYPGMIVTKIIGTQNAADCDETYYNTVVGVAINPDYVWQTDEHGDDIVVTNDPVIVENEKIRVTMSANEYASYRDNAESMARIQKLPSGDIRHHDPDKVQRGLVLSTAMKILGNQYEAMQLDQEDFALDETELSIVTAEAMAAAKNTYIEEYLSEHTKYHEGETFSRYLTGRRLSQGMEFELDAAIAYACAATGNINFAKLFHDTSAKYTEYRTRMVLSAAKEGLDNKHLSPGEHMESILAFKKMMFEIERKYRHRFDGNTWEITVLRPDLMPDQIGLCRYAPPSSADFNDSIPEDI